MAVTRNSPRYLLQILEAVAFMFSSLGTIQITAGGETTATVSYTQGRPTITNADLDAFVLTFYAGATGSTTRAGTVNIGDAGHQMSLSEIITISHDSDNDRYDITINTSTLEISSTEDVYFGISVQQPDP